VSAHVIPFALRGEARTGGALVAGSLALAYAGYVAFQLPSLTVPVLALTVGLAAALLFEAARAGDGRQSAWCASFAVILAALHARALPEDARFAEIQIGLAAFALSSATLTLLRPRRAAPVALLATVVIALALGVGATMGAVAFVAALVGASLAASRPLSALAVIRGRPSEDPWLVWRPLSGGR
jgi:hypothetical protein